MALRDKLRYFESLAIKEAKAATSNSVVPKYVFLHPNSEHINFLQKDDIHSLIL